MLNHVLYSRVVELEGDINMLRVYEEDHASGQKECVVMNLGQAEVRIGHSETETVNKELEKSAC
jgi:hypothetical protein